MFFKTYFDKKVAKFNQTKEEFNACFDRKDYVAAKERLEYLYSLIESRRACLILLKNGFKTTDNRLSNRFRIKE